MRGGFEGQKRDSVSSLAERNVYTIPLSQIRVESNDL